MDLPTPNAQQITFWNEQGGPRWVALQELLDRELAPLGPKVMDRIGVAAGDHVIDVGCGCGATTLELARRVGGAGSVLAVDVSRPMLDRAEERARDAGFTNASCVLADAQSFPFQPAAADVVFSRFGVMFFDDPTAAFTNLRRALRAGGRIGFVCWQAFALNPMMLLPAQAVAAHVALPEPAAPGAPGPFAFADGDRTRGLLTAAGFASVEVSAFETMLTIDGGGTVDDVVSFLLQLGPAAAALRGADPGVASRVHATLREAITPFESEGIVRIPAALWMVSGENPGLRGV